MLVDATGTHANVTGAIRHAARVTGTSFDYLLATAQVESGLNPGARATTSSARGLFQFIEQTWLATLKESGPQLGYSRYASAIVRTETGRYSVADPVLRDEILKLRHDPTANAVMAGAFTHHNAAKLAERLGRPARESELYMAHFLGAGGAARLIAHASDRPEARAADLFPQAARANPSIFYDHQGRARSVAQVYGQLASRYEVARVAPIVPAVATAGQRGPRMAAAAPENADLADRLAATNAAVRPADNGPVFHSLFRTGERPEPVAPAVRELWNPHSSTGGKAPNGQGSGEPLDLLGTMRPNVRGLFLGKS
jgi:hypothetical protein